MRLSKFLAAFLIFLAPVLAQGQVGPVSGGVPPAVTTALATKINKRTLAQLGSTKQVYIWYRTDGVAGTGTESDPFDGSTQAKFDALMVSLQGITGLHIHLGPAPASAPFQTNVAVGYFVKSGWFIQGAGMYVTTVKEIGNMAGQHYGHYAFYSDSTVSTDNITISDLTIDCNASVLSASADTGAGGEKNYKVAGINLYGSNNLVERVRVINSFGSLANEQERFDIAISSPAGMASSGNTIRFCRTETPSGNYGSPFLLAGDSAGHLMSGSRVYDCKASGVNNGLNGGYNTGGVNCAWVIDVQVFNNYFEDCFSVFYSDTGTAEKVRVFGNTLVRGANGIALVSAQAKQDIEFINNNLIIQNRLAIEVSGITIYGGTTTNVVIAGNNIKFQTDGGASANLRAIYCSQLANVNIVNNISDGDTSTSANSGTNLRFAGNRTSAGAAVTGLNDTDTVTATSLKFTSAFALSTTDPTNGQVLTYNSGTGKIEGTTLSGGGTVSDTAYGSGWNAVTTVSPSKNATYDYLHLFDTDDDGKVDVLDISVAGVVQSTSGGVPSSTLTPTLTGFLVDGNAVTLPSAVGTVVYKDTADIFTNKTFDAAATGNVFKRNEYIQLGFPDNGDGTNAVRVTTEGATFGHYTFLNGTDKASNYVIYRFRVPDDIDTAVDLAASFSFRLGGADTGKHAYAISMADVTASASADSPTFSNEIALSFAGDASGASGDMEQVAYTTLTTWRSSLTAGHIIVVKLARDGDDGTLDTSTVDSTDLNLTIRYGSSQ